jgi:hypothetical protein
VKIGADIESDLNLLVAGVQTRLKAIEIAGKRKQRWNLERIKSKKKPCERSDRAKIKSNRWNNVEGNWRKAKETRLDILNNDIGKMHQENHGYLKQ